MPSRRILYTVLNWGLGHASRSIPIIQELHSRGHEIIIASDGRAGSLLQKEFPHLPYRALPGYQADYRYPLPIRYGRLIYHTWRAIKAEKTVIDDWMCDESYEFIISDNRYGTFHPKAKNIFITHQLNLPVTRIFRPLARKALKELLTHFDLCWIPDTLGADNLSGSLSANHAGKKSVHIGWQSRLKKLAIEKRYDYAIVLSGPEPHRTQLERELRDQLKYTSGNAVMVLGKTDEERGEAIEHMMTYPSLTSDHLNEIICASKILVGRAGYSTMMDCLSMQQPAILIPTPGQPEQQYLAKRHADHPLWVMQMQGQVVLQEGLSALQSRVPYQPRWDPSSAMLRRAMTDIGL